jgi:hypothetical protein
MSEQRQHPRYAIELDAELDGNDGEHIVGRTRDLSKGGFCLTSRNSIPVGLEVNAKLALVFSESEFSEQLTLPAQVMWCTPFQGMFQIGVKLGQLDPQHRGYLDMFVKFLEGGGEEETVTDENADEDEGGA